MSVTFYACAAGDVLGERECNVTATNAVQLLTLLGYPEPVALVAECVPQPPLEFVLRCSVAEVEGITVAEERWPHLPGYFAQRLGELAAVANEALTLGGMVVWA